jgi:alpha-galactosidase
MNQDRFVDVHFTQEPFFTVTYRSGMMVYEEGLLNGIYSSLGWSGSGYSGHTHNVPQPIFLDTNLYIEPQSFLVEVDGQLLHSHWTLEHHQVEPVDKGLHIQITLMHQIRPVTVIVHTLLDGTSILTRWIEVVNRSSEHAAVGTLVPMAGGMRTIKRWRSHVKDGQSPFRVGYMENTGHLSEGIFKWHDLPNAGYYFGARYLRQRYRHPMFILEDRAMGAHFICQFAWSGGYRFSFDLNREFDDAHLSFRVAHDAPNPLRILQGHENACSAEVHIGMMYGDLDACIQAMHDHVRQSVMLPQARGRGMWIEAGIGPEVVMSQEAVLDAIDKSAELGIEIFFIDAGWFSKPGEEKTWYARAGDWEPDLERYPMGIEGIRDYTHQKGMLFGLWMEPERFGSDSRMLELHPDWCTYGYDDKMKGSIVTKGGMVDVAKPEAAAWVEQQMAQLIERFELDFFRLDFNVGTLSPKTYNSKHHYLENADWRYYENFYGIMERLRDRFPDVVFEACAGGGGRTDLGLVRYYNHTWVTDHQLAPRSFAITNGMTMCLPPEYVDRLLTNQAGFSTASLEFQARLLLFVRPTIGVHTPPGFKTNPVQQQKIKHMLDLHRHFVRPIMPESKIYHHTPEVSSLDPKGTGILELVSKTREKAILGIFQLSDPDHEDISVRFKGLDASKRYRITLDNLHATFEIEGYRLITEGIQLHVGPALTSELVIAEAI